jgi:predicted nucleic acid-binding protein
MVFDTDVLIWFLRGSAKAARAIDAADQRIISVVTYMELIQGARDKREIRGIKAYLADLHFGTLPLSENIGHRASIYMEEYGLASSLNMADALIAATAIESKEALLTGNVRHFRAIKELQCRPFRP